MAVLNEAMVAACLFVCLYTPIASMLENTHVLSAANESKAVPV